MELQLLVPQQVQLLEATSQQTTENFTLIKDRVLLSPGVWNGLMFSAEEIKKAFLNTDWSKKENYALIYDHDEKAVNWLGNVINIRYDETSGTLLGDLQIYDKAIAVKLTEGGAKLGISAKVLGMEDESGSFVNFTFNNFSVVYEPACKKAYINLSKDELLIKIKELEKRVQILEGETNADATEGDSIGDSSIAKTNQKIKYKKKKKLDEESNSQDLKGGLNSVTMSEENQNQPVEEIVEAPVEESVEESPVEEAVEEAPVAEEAKAEAVEEAPEAEESSEEAEELSSKLDKVLAAVETLSKRIAKLEEEESEAVEAEEEVSEEVAEELSAKDEPRALSIEAQAPKMKSALLGKQYSPGEMRLAEVLLKNAK